MDFYSFSGLDFEVSLPILYHIVLNLDCQLVLYYADGNKSFVNDILNEFTTNNLKVNENMSIGSEKLALLLIIYISSSQINKIC